MITHLGFRIVLGLHILLLGILLLLIYANRHRSNLWGRFSAWGTRITKGEFPIGSGP